MQEEGLGVSLLLQVHPPQSEVSMLLWQSLSTERVEVGDQGLAFLGKHPPPPGIPHLLGLGPMSGLKLQSTDPWS